jgi:CO/xanthine dehydrogenase FAD-binding subunit
LAGLVSRATRAQAVEKALAGKSLDAAAIAAAAAQVSSDLGGDVTGDIFASAKYRAAVAPVYVKRAIAAAAARAGLA